MTLLQELQAERDDVIEKIHREQYGRQLERQVAFSEWLLSTKPSQGGPVVKVIDDLNPVSI